MMNFLRQFHVFNAHLLSPNDRILAAVSGGIDSMTMLHVLLQCGYQVAVAHCNFSLRGAESDGDELFVTNYSKEHNIPCYVKKFNTTNYATTNHLSIEMAARELRYAWFAEVAASAGFNKIAIAHNADDSIETFFLNLLRSTGLRGLTGIAAKHGNIVRPLLFATRNDIVNFAHFNNIPFREDSTNSSDKFLRNQLRHKIIPALCAVSPSFSITMQQNMKFISQAAALCTEHVDTIKSSIVQCKGVLIYVKICEIPVAHRLFFLHELLREYGFVGKTIEKIAVAAQFSGKLFHSSTHELLCDRGTIILRKRSVTADCSPISIGIEDMNVPIKLSASESLVCSVIPMEEVDFSHGESCAFLDYDKLVFPLVVRHPQRGDYFVPLGMTGRKKLSDYFIDQKMNLFEKHSQWLVVSGSSIVWVAARRMDDRYKIVDNTRKVMKIKI